ncbi:hypothetical protein GCM10010140_40420 [Streptosporangium pseudovulgare]|uniref:Uncharacterized protein n=1 Tax=Streptosporangium pseudovulgare TaxID=35765 RepID=A0ABQ2R350_9ACTN|nr:hypothetical protein GCM10010140_40420 [Streptosporangium pseudovulgare]
MSFGVTQVVLLAMGCWQGVLGIYALMTDRMPRVAIFLHGHRDPRRYAWGSLLLTACLFSLVGHDLTEPGSAAGTAVLVLSAGLAVGAAWLLAFPLNRSQGSS